MNNNMFNEDHVLHELKHYLPTQLALKDFVHHNSLHAFEDLSFFDAIFKASEMFGIQVTFNLNEYRKLYEIGRIRIEIIEDVIRRQKGPDKLPFWKARMLNEKFDFEYNPKVGRIRAYWKKAYKIDLDNLVQPLLFRIIGGYLDQGVALWHFPFEDQGLINAILELEKSSYSSFFRSKRVKELLFDPQLNIQKLLGIIVGDEAYFESYIYDQQFLHKGWSGIVAAIEDTPHTLLYQKKVHLKDLILLELLLELDVLDTTFGKNWEPLAEKIDVPPTDYFAKHDKTEMEDILELWQLAFEWDYYDGVLAGLKFAATSYRIADRPRPSFQGIFCVDDREDSIRRHIELTDKNAETLGAPGFFGAAFYFQPFGGKFYEKNCPVVITPKHLIKEVDVKEKRKSKIFHSKHSHTFLRGFLASLSLGLWAAFRLILDVFRPRMQPDISNAFAHMNLNGKLIIENEDPNNIENGLQVGYTVPEMADVIYSILTGIGLTTNFAPIVYVVAHGGSTANNPHHGAYDCGACSGRPGSVNARVFAFMANHTKVRSILSGKGLNIPEKTQFLGAMHDTSSDDIAFYDVDILSKENLELHQKNIIVFDKALDQNAKERARRFASVNIKKDLKHIRNAIKKRSMSYFEPRPELGHGSNALCYIGGRDKIKGLFLDRRAFLQSYDYRKDADGSTLLSVLGPLPGVCGGINLEYYFSRMDNHKMGAGTKLSHNVVGLFAVSNSSDGDLRSGLPLQMIENHDPVRLLMMIEQRPEIVKKVIKSSAGMSNWFDNIWIHLVVISPDNHQLYYYTNGEFVEYDPITVVDGHTKDIMKIIERARQMETNHILDATTENLPVFVYNDDESHE